MKMMSQELLRIPVSFYRNMKDSIAEPFTIERILKGIRSDFYESQIKRIRQLKNEGKKKEADELKGNLHAVTFCATFNNRRKSSLCTGYNSLMVIDVDKLDTNEMQRVRKCLEDNPYIACYWISPSGAGWKGLVPLNYINDSPHIDIVDKHHWAFMKLEETFNDDYSVKLDASGKDITRLCFMSWHPELRLKNEFKRFDVDLNEMTKVHKHQNDSSKKMVLQSSGEPIMWNIIDGQKQENRTGNAYDRRLLERIYKYLKNRNESITAGYENWVKMAFAIAHTFHSVYGRRMFMKFCELDGPLHDEAKSERLIYDAYTTPEKRCDFSTIIYMAKGKGFVR